MAITESSVAIDIGFKSEGLVPITEFPNIDELKPGDEIEVFLESVENKDGQLVLSRKRADFMRTWSERVYSIPPEQVVGSTALTKYELRQSGPVLIKTKAHLFVDDGEGKPVGIHAFIGRRPIACFGNCDGDKAMLDELFKWASAMKPMRG